MSSVENENHAKINLNCFSKLFEIVYVTKVPKKHWSPEFGWNMVNYLAAMTLATHTKAKFLSIFVDEVDTIDSQF